MPRKNRPNPGWFQRGYDPRHHVLTTQERRLGGANNVRRHYMGGAYAQYLGQSGTFKDLTLKELAQLAGDDDRPGRRPGR